MQLFFSQEANDENVVKLSEQRDEFGLRKINISHSIPTDEINVHQSRLEALLGRSVEGMNLDRLGEEHVHTGRHPSCTTPMVNNGEYGTLDTDLRVNGFDNLYSVGSNVFPTNGVTNPTWTIMVFARRLANHVSDSGAELNKNNLDIPRTGAII